MSEKLTNTQMEDFLQDFEKRSETVILEEGKEKDELTKIAEARGIKIKGSRDLAVFKTIYGFVDVANSNGAILPKKELLRVLPQIVGKPININHERRFVVGHYIDYRYKQKDSQINAYGIYYKSNFGKEFEEAKKLLKKKKLSSSFEIWSPQDKRTYKEDGSFEMHQMEIAGGALIYEDKDNEPAFKNAKVLMMAVENQEKPELVYSKKYKEDEIIHVGKDKLIKAQESFNCSCPKCGTKTTSNNHCNTTKCPKCGTLMRRANRPGTGNPQNSPNVNSGKIKCSNCGNEFETGEGQVNIKCPKCYAILNKEGVIQYPPQIKDFKILCPSCKLDNWLIISRNEQDSKLKCLGCSKEYIVTFAKKNKENILGKTRFIYTGSVTCHQCNKRIPIESISDINIRQIKCPKCGLQFSVDTYEETYKKIARIEAIQVSVSEPIKSSKEGGQKMDKKEKVEKKTTVQEPVKIEKEPKKEEVKPIVKESKKEEPKVLEQPQKPEVKVVDKKEEIKPEPPKVKDEPKVVDVKVIKKTDPPKIDVIDAEKTIVKLEDEVEKAKQLKVASLLKRYPKVVKKAIDKIRKVRKELVEAKKKLNTKMEKAVKKLETKVEFYKENAKKILERQTVIGIDRLTDEEILNDDKFERAKL